MKKILLVLACAAAIFTHSVFAEEALEGMVDRFKKATSVEREEIKNLSMGKEFYGSGVIQNVEKSRFFNDMEKVEKSCYTVKTDVLRTPAGNAYQIIFFYNDMEAVESLKKGEKLAVSGRLVNIVDKGLWLYVWLDAQQ